MSPLTLVRQFDGSALASVNCNCAVTAMLIAFATGGAKRPTAAQVRAWVRDPDGGFDTTGGTNPVQVADAARRGFGVHLDVEFGQDFALAWATGQRQDRAVGISIGYAPVSGTMFDGSPGFRGNHQVMLSGGLVYDPLADGRIRGSWHAPLGPDDWPMALLKNAAGKLNLAAPPAYRALGYGRAYTVTAIAPTVKASRFSVKFTPGSFWAYSVAGGQIVGRQAWRFSHDTSAPCDAPEVVAWPGKNARRLVRVSRGVLNGRYLEPGNESHVTLVRL